MLNSTDHEHHAQDQEDQPQAQDVDLRSHPQALAKASSGDEEAQVEPYFPDLNTAVEANKAALEGWGQTNHALLRPEVLEGALGRAQNYWYYENSLPKAAAALAHGVGQAQAFEDGNKRTAYWLTHHFLHENGLGHMVPEDDEELADHLVGYGEGTHGMEDTAAMFEGRQQPPHVANILDPIQTQLDPSVFNKPDSPRPVLRPEHTTWITKTLFELLDNNGYDSPQNWLTIVLTGSLTTYQYSEHSDCDVSLFVNTTAFPDWSRAEMIGLMIEHMDGQNLPGTTHAMQDFVVSPKLSKEDLYKPGLRSAYVVYGDNAGQWLVPPERERVHDVEHEENEAYTIALENADKMEHLLRYEPDKAVMFWHQIHKRRMRDQNAGKGDYSPSNITYKFLANRGLFPRLEEVSGEHIARA